MLKKTFITGLCAAACSLALTAQTPVTLASWTFETGYDVSDIGDKTKLYTPGGAAISELTGWSNQESPIIIPETAEGDASAYTLSGYSENRYFQITNGYNTRVFRLANTVGNDITDFTNPTQHKFYWEVNFPTKGYKGISIDLSIAPGNNIQTPVEIVVSTDGGTTWFDAGHVNTSGNWFTYDKAHTDLSVNDKENVTVRLVPVTTENSNWNLDFLTISASDKVAAPETVNENNFKVTWPLGNGVFEANPATADRDGLFSVTALTFGDNLREPTNDSKFRTVGSLPMTLVQPTDIAGTNEAANALSFEIKPKKGLTFKPTAFDFKVTKNGTNGGKITVELIADGKTYTLHSGTPSSLIKNGVYDRVSLKLTDVPATADLMTYRIYMTGVANNKNYAFADVVVTGDIQGTVEPVPAYSLSLKSNINEAGMLACIPGGNEFDEGTKLSVSASENFGYHFSHWADADGKVVSDANPYIFEISAHTTLTAVYIATPVYALNLSIEGGANVNQVICTPSGNIVDGVHYYEEGTDVSLKAVNNRILTFMSWDDNSTTPERIVRMDGDKNVTANFSAADYIVGWDFYFDDPKSNRAADFKAESNNAGLFSLRNAEGTTSGWLSRGIINGMQDGRSGAMCWKKLEDKYYFEFSFSAAGYSNIKMSTGINATFNTYSKGTVEWSADGSAFSKFADYELVKGWSDFEFDLPAKANGQARIHIRFQPDYSSAIVGSTGYNDGFCVGDLYILADRESVNDNEAPKLVTTIPANGDDGASSTGSIVLTFDEKVIAGKDNATLNGEAITGTFSGKSVIYKYANLPYATTCTFTVPAGAITDRSGNSFEGISLTFTTMERTQPEARLYDAIVAADGSGDFTSVQAAIDAAPASCVKPYLIFIKNGKYNEHVDVPKAKPFLHFIGQDRDKTVILDDKLCGGDNALHVSAGATVVVNSDDCLFENITLENSYGHEKQTGPQALALNTIGDRTIFNNVAMLSYQDTWITPSTSNYRAYVRNSFIEGAVDFIYNSGNIYIDNTTLYINRENGGYIVAPSHAADVKWGYVFNNCTITAPGVPSETSVWLGRPWHNSPKTVFLNTRAEVTIPATGWYETMGGLPVLWADWNTVDADGNPLDLSQRRDTYYYKTADGEKVYGKAKNFLTDEEAAQYTVKNVLSGSDNWEPVIKTESCDTPVVTMADGELKWDAVPYAICYVITRGDKVIDIIKETTCSLTALPATETDEAYCVQAVNEFGGLSAKGIANDNQSGIDNIITDSADVTVEIYDVRGMRHTSLVPGVNIVKRTDAGGNAKVEKIIVR